jgi:hypothetical protein
MSINLQAEFDDLCAQYSERADDDDRDRATTDAKLARIGVLMRLAAVDPSTHDNRALNDAVRRGSSVRLVDALLTGGVDPSRDRSIALAMACMQHDRLAILERLLADARIDPSHHSNDALHTAVVLGHAPYVERLLRDPRVVATMHAAIRISPNVPDIRPLHTACRLGHVDVVDLLLRTTTLDPFPTTSFRCRTFAVTLLNGHARVLELLIADPRIQPHAFCAPYDVLRFALDTHAHLGDTTAERLVRDARLRVDGALLALIDRQPARVIARMAPILAHKPSFASPSPTLVAIAAHRRVVSRTLGVLVARRLVCRDVARHVVRLFV